MPNFVSLPFLPRTTSWPPPRPSHFALACPRLDGHVTSSRGPHLCVRQMPSLIYSFDAYTLPSLDSAVISKRVDKLRFATGLPEYRLTAYLESMMVTDHSLVSNLVSQLLRVPVGEGRRVPRDLQLGRAHRDRLQVARRRGGRWKKRESRKGTLKSS